MDKLLDKTIPFLLILVMVQGVAQWVEISLLPTVVWWIVQFLILLSYGFAFLTWRGRGKIWLILFLVWVLISAIRGLFLAEGRWDYKALVESLLVFSMPMGVARYADPKAVQRDGKGCLLFCLPLFAVLVWAMQSEAVGRLFFFLPFFLMFLPDLKVRHAVYILFILLLVIVFGTVGARTMVFRLAGALVCSLPLILRRIVRTEGVVKFGTVFFFLAPFAFFVIAITTGFNIFTILEGNKGKYIIYDENGTVEEEDLSADTRTFIFEEAITSAWRNHYIAQGHSLARGYESETFGDTDLISFRRGERQNGEVGILNIFTHMGLIGGFLYMFILVAASASAVRRSLSLEMKILGLWIAFRFFLSWIEEFTVFDLNNVYLWMMVGMCLSPSFLRMDSAQFRRFINQCLPFNKVSLKEKSKSFRSIS